MKTWIAVILGLIVVAGGGYYFTQSQKADGVVNTEQETSKTGDPFQDGFKEGETNFLARTDTINGTLMVRFGAQIVRPDGGDYEAAVIFGDGDEETVAHWAPTLFNEGITHTYRQSGEYTASLVLVPKSLLTEDVRQYRTKIQDLKGTIVIKTIHVSVKSSGEVTVQN